jgi:opacity protein-like surface antigen
MKTHLKLLLLALIGAAFTSSSFGQTPQPQPPPGYAPGLPPAYTVPPQGYPPPPAYAPVQQPAYVPRFYVQADAGGQVTMDTSLKEFFGEPLTPGSKVTFDPGPRFGVLGGFRACDWFAVEAEFGYMMNQIDSITDATRIDHAYLANAPFLINARFTCPPHWWFAPYFGGGLGGSVTTIHADDIDIGATHMDGWASAGVFAYQAFGGFRFKINDRMAVSVAYHYFATTDSTFHADFTSGTGSDHLRFGGTETHVGSVAFEWNF